MRKQGERRHGGVREGEGWEGRMSEGKEEGRNKE